MFSRNSFQQLGNSLTNADAHGDQGQGPSGSAIVSSRAAVKVSRTPLIPRGGLALWRAVGIDVGCVIRQSQRSQHGQGLRCERLVDLDDIQVFDAQLVAFQQPIGGWYRPDAHDSGATPAVAAPTTRASGRSPNSSTFLSDASRMAAAPSLIPLELPAVTDPFPEKAGLPALALQRRRAGVHRDRQPVVPHGVGVPPRG